VDLKTCKSIKIPKSNFCPIPRLFPVGKVKRENSDRVNNFPVTVLLCRHTQDGIGAANFPVPTELLIDSLRPSCKLNEKRIALKILIIIIIFMGKKTNKQTKIHFLKAATEQQQSTKI